MNEQPYSNREIKEMFEDIKKDLGEIKTQTTKTNGRVSELEGWRQYTTGASKVVAVIVVPLILWMTYRIASVPTVTVAQSQHP